MGEQPANVSVAPTVSGAIYKPLHVERTVKIYPIQEHELTTLNMFAGIVTVCGSIAGGAVGFMLNVWWDVASSPSSATQTVGNAVTKICGRVIVICLIVGVWAFRSKKSELAKIISESKVV